MEISGYNQPGSSWYSMTIKADQDDVSTIENFIYQENRNYFNVPGFRRGKAPLGLIKARYGKDFFLEDVADIIAHQSVDDVNEDKTNNFLVSKNREISDLDFELNEDGSLEITFQAPKAIYTLLKTGSFSFEPDELDFEVSEEDIEEELKRQQEENKIYKKVERPIKEGDRVTYNLTAFYDRDDHTEIVESELDNTAVVTKDSTFYDWIGETAPFEEILKEDEDEAALVNRYGITRVDEAQTLEIDDQFPGLISVTEEEIDLDTYKANLKEILEFEKQQHKFLKLGKRFLKQIISEAELNAEDWALEQKEETLPATEEALFSYFQDYEFSDADTEEEEFEDFLKLLDLIHLFKEAFTEESYPASRVVSYSAKSAFNGDIGRFGLDPKGIQSYGSDRATLEAILLNFAAMALSQQRAGENTVETPFFVQGEVVGAE